MAAAAVAMPLSTLGQNDLSSQLAHKRTSTPVDAAELCRRLEMYQQIKTTKSARRATHVPTSQGPAYIPRYANRVAAAKDDVERTKKANRHSYHSGTTETWTAPRTTTGLQELFAQPATIRQFMAGRDSGNAEADHLSRLPKRADADLQYTERQARQISLALLEGKDDDNGGPSRHNSKRRSYIPNDPKEWSHINNYTWNPALPVMNEAERPKLQVHDRHNWEQASQMGDGARDLLHLKSVRHKPSKDNKLERIPSASHGRQSASHNLRQPKSESVLKSKNNGQASTEASAVVKVKSRRSLFGFLRRLSSRQKA